MRVIANQKELYDIVHERIKEGYKNCYFLTVDINDPYYTRRRNGQDLYPGITRLWGHYQKTYRFICSMMSRNWAKKLPCCPRTLDFIDFPGTAHGQFSGYQHSENPHFHSVYMLTDQWSSRFQQLIDSNFSGVTNHPALPFLASIHAAPIEDTTGNLRRVLGYSSKFASSKVTESDDLRGVPVIDMYPDPSWNLRSVQRSPKTQRGAHHAS